MQGKYDTGTGWGKFGDETGFYSDDKIYDIWIEGEVEQPAISTSFGGRQRVYHAK